MSLTEIRVSPGDWDSVLEESDGPQMIVAGPGTGKTEFLVQRVARLISSGRTTRDRVAVLTFSRRAAASIGRRIEDHLGGSGMPIETSTFHSLALRLLETGADGERPVPLTTPEQIGLVAELLTEEDPDDWPVSYRGILSTGGFAAEVADFLMRCSERLLSPEELAQKAASRADWRGIPGLFQRYRQRLSETGRTDYGTMLVSAVELLGTPAGRRLASRFDYVVVDEYQDTTPAQAEMARLLAADHENLTVAGDPYQSIYSFRGAELRNVSLFSVQHPRARRIVLEKSLRVPVQIMDAALRIVSQGDLPGAAGPVRPADHPGRVKTYVFDQETAEAEWIAADIEHAVRVEGIQLKAIAVLVRSKRELLNELSRALARRSIPHDSPDSRLGEHPAVRMIHDVVTLANHGGSLPLATPGESAEADRAMRRLMLGPLMRLGLGREREVVRERRRSWDPWPDVLRRELPAMTGLIGLLDDPAWATDRPASDGFWEIWSRLDGVEQLVLDPDRADWRLALTSLAQVLARQAERDPSLSLTRFFQLTDDEGFEATPLFSFRPVEDRVTLTTLHQAKGLEFDYVYIANAVEGIFPDLRRGRRMLRPELLSPERTTDPHAQHLFQVQEEMRLAYTAMTRAKRRVVWTATEAGVDQGEHRPSRFLRAAADPARGVVRAPRREEAEMPITLSEAEIRLRRVLLDPGAPEVERLAAVRVLAHPPRPWWDCTTFAGVPARGPDSPLLGEDFRLSPSQADAYVACPRKYALERRLRLGDAVSPYAQFGTLVHAALEAAERENLPTGKAHADLDTALAHLERVWAAADFGTPQLNEAWLHQARETLTRLYSNWPTPDAIPVDLEMRVEHRIADVEWIGYVDRLERTGAGLRVVDYKTSKSPPTRAEAERSIQLAFYAEAVRAMTGEPVVEAQMWFPRKEAKSVTTRSLDMDLIDEIRLSMVTVAESIRDERWEPKVSDRCDRCEFKSSCPGWPEGNGAYLP